MTANKQTEHWSSGLMNENNSTSPQAEDASEVDRRGFLYTASSVAMAGGLAASYGTLGYMAARFLYPPGGSNVGWLFVSTLDDFAVDESLVFTAPSGATMIITRQTDAGTEDDFVALSNVCPHLGCQVRWETQNNRFFCPCHNGVFDPTGKAVEGPPAKANQNLTPFPLKVINGLLFVEVPLKGIGQKVASVDSPNKEAQPPTREA
jgi:nitrite reductase/ring-hydroxylating ferredoxin subunit